MNERVEKYYLLKSNLEKVNKKIKDLEEYRSFYIGTSGNSQSLSFDKNNSPEIFEKIKEAVVQNRDDIQKLMNEI